MAKFAPTKHHGGCEETATSPPPTVGDGATGLMPTLPFPDGQVVDASGGNGHCIALPHTHLRPRVEQPGKYRKIADRVYKLKIGQHFDVKLERFLELGHEELPKLRL